MESVLQAALVVFQAPAGAVPPAPGVELLISQYLMAALAEDAARASTVTVDRRVNLLRMSCGVWGLLGWEKILCLAPRREPADERFSGIGVTLPEGTFPALLRDCEFGGAVPMRVPSELGPGTTATSRVACIATSPDPAWDRDP